MISKKESHKHKKRIDGIAALVNALAGHLSEPEETDKYSKSLSDDEIYI